MDLTATDRKALIRLASSLPKGSPERKTILAGLKVSGPQLYDIRDFDFDLSFSPDRGNTVLWKLDDPQKGARWAKDLSRNYGLKANGWGQNSLWAYISVVTPEEGVLERFTKAIRKRSPIVRVGPNNPFILDTPEYKDH